MALCNHFDKAVGLLNGVLDELLAAEAGVHTHEEHKVKVFDDVFE